MSKRRISGEVVTKMANAGFVGEELTLKIPDPATWSLHWDYSIEQNKGPCLMDCGDYDCIEYSNIEVLDSKGEHAGWCCHVSECQMKDLKK